MISGSEAREAFIQIESILLRSDLYWLVSQIQEEIARGKITSKQIKEIKNNRNLALFESEYYVARNSSKEEVQTSELYSEQEQLELLLNALQEISEINLIRKQIITNLKSIDAQINTVAFTPEESNNDLDVLTEDSLQSLDRPFTRLTSIVNQLKAS